MRSPKILSSIGGLLGAAALAVAPTPVQASEKPKPNIIFVLADDMGYGDLGCYGGTGAQTKNIDRLASEGIRFTQFYVNSPICSPSRTALTTGQYPARWNITSYIDNRAANSRRGMAQWLDVSAPTLARTLTQSGYLTGHFGKWHMGGGRDVGEAPLPTEYGFNESLTQFEGLGDRVLPLVDKGERKMSLGIASEKLGRGNVSWVKRSEVTRTFVQRALNFIQKAEKANKPFYLNLWPDDVHSPFFPPANLRGDGSKKALYHGVLTNMDAQLGPLFDAIRQNPKLRANTLIIFASDNGPEGGAGSAGRFRGSKGTLYEGGIREPFIVWGPGLIEASKRGTVNKTAVISGVDLFPSLTNLIGIKAPQGDGSDLSATLVGKKPTGRTQPLFWKRPPDRGGNPKASLSDLAIRDGNWKLLVDRNGRGAQLYNLADDERETENVAELNPKVTERLRQALLAWNRTLPSAEQEVKRQFVLKYGAHLNRNEAPEIAERSFTLTIKFNALAPNGDAANGVIVAQGGVANGYTLYVDENSNLNFLVRQNKQSYLVTAPKLSSGDHIALARFGHDGTITLSIDGQTPIQGKAPRTFSQQPLDGLDVGSDQGGLVGPYKDSSNFTGSIESVNIDMESAQ
jgi:arylsulfatase A-like enzyme